MISFAVRFAVFIAVVGLFLILINWFLAASNFSHFSVSTETAILTIVGAIMQQLVYFTQPIIDWGIVISLVKISITLWSFELMYYIGKWAYGMLSRIMSWSAA